MPEKNNILSTIEIEKIVRSASLEGRPADFRGKTLSTVILREKTIDDGLNFEGAIILGSISLEQTVIKGDVNLNNASVNGSVYLGASVFKGDIKMEKAIVKGVVNFVGAKIYGSLFCNNLNVSGFLSLAQAEIKGEANLENLKINDAYYAGLIIQGDVYLRKAIIGSHFSIANSSIEGTLDMLETQVTGDANLNSVNVKEFFIMKETKIKGLTKMEGIKYKELIDK